VVLFVQASAVECEGCACIGETTCPRNLPIRYCKNSRGEVEQRELAELGAIKKAVRHRDWPVEIDASPSKRLEETSTVPPVFSVLDPNWWTIATNRLGVWTKPTADAQLPDSVAPTQIDCSYSRAAPRTNDRSGRAAEATDGKVVRKPTNHY